VRISGSKIANAGQDWGEIIRQLGVDGHRALEIGAGTGALTLGLLREGIVDDIIATDVSHDFLRNVAKLATEHGVSVSLVACDANEQHFAPESFDLVLGRSILHHLLDYDVTLRHCREMLTPNGCAVFYEPVLEGKTVVSLLMAVLLGCDEASDNPRLSDVERKKIKRLIRHQTKSSRALDREALSKLEDKYIFRIDELKEKGIQAGFTDVEFINWKNTVDPSYWKYVASTFGLKGIKPQTIAPYRFIGDAFAETFGLMFPDKLVTPMGFFVFRR
jgi:2-polyprenyl-3-methyl-5-hydroxy-6-metoxy-1,4-benzoquinol methylase